MPANGIWFWAEGTAAALPDFAQRYGHTGAVISAVPLCHGIAKLCGLEVVHVPGATGEVDTNYDGKVRAALQALQRHDFVAVHLEGPDECTHCGDLPGKITAIERLDALVVGPITQELRRKGERFRMLILSDHKTLMEGNGAHDGDGVPFLLYDSRDTCGGIRERYTEACGLRGLSLPAGTELMPLLFQL